jgi:crotonobetainyl-CoA:carnitine CoA-transferase CaiB-like acyl-CoA transferase
VRNREILIPMLAEAFATRPANAWLAALEAASVPCAPIRAMDEVFASPEGAALVETIADPRRGGTLSMVRNPLRFDGDSLITQRPPPALGEHTDEALGR